MGNVLQYIKIVVATQFMLYIMHFFNLHLLKNNLKQKIQSLFTRNNTFMSWLLITSICFNKETKTNGIKNEALPRSWWAGCVMYVDSSCADPDFFFPRRGDPRENFVWRSNCFINTITRKIFFHTQRDLILSLWFVDN